MDLTHVSGVKQVAAGGDLDAAVALEVTQEVVNVMMKGEYAESYTSQSPLPNRRLEIGTNIEVKGIYENADYDQLVIIAGGAYATTTYTKAMNVVRALPLYDVRLEVYRPSDGGTVEWTITNMQSLVDIEMAMKYKEFTYLPFRFVGTKSSVLTIDNS